MFMVLVLLSASVERCFVSNMRDFLLNFQSIFFIYVNNPGAGPEIVGELCLLLCQGQDCQESCDCVPLHLGAGRLHCSLGQCCGVRCKAVHCSGMYDSAS